MVPNLISGFSGFRQLASERVHCYYVYIKRVMRLYIGGGGLTKYGVLHSCIRQARVVGRQKYEIGPPELIDEKYFNTGCIGEFRGFPVVPGIPKTSILSIDYFRRPDLAFLASNHSSLPSTRV